MVLCSLFIKLQLSHRKRVSQMLHGQGSGHVYSVQGQLMITKPYWTKINWYFRPKVTSFLCGVHTGWILYVPIIMKQFMCWHGSPTNWSILFPTQWSWMNVNAAPLSSLHYSYLIGSRYLLPALELLPCCLETWVLAPSCHSVLLRHHRGQCNEQCMEEAVG